MRLLSTALCLRSRLADLFGDAIERLKRPKPAPQPPADFHDFRDYPERDRPEHDASPYGGRMKAGS